MITDILLGILDFCTFETIQKVRSIMDIEEWYLSKFILIPWRKCLKSDTVYLLPTNFRKKFFLFQITHYNQSSEVFTIQKSETEYYYTTPNHSAIIIINNGLNIKWITNHKVSNDMPGYSRWEEELFQLKSSEYSFDYIDITDQIKKGKWLGREKTIPLRRILPSKFLLESVLGKDFFE